MLLLRMFLALPALLRSGNHESQPGGNGRSEPVTKFVMKCARQQAVGSAGRIARFVQPQIRPRPDEAIGFRENHP